MDFVIGEEIRRIVLEKGMTFVAFADKIGMTDRNLQSFFKRNDISIQQLVRASEILDYDFISEYVKHRKPKYKNRYNGPVAEEPKQVYERDRITMSINISAHFSTYTESFPEFITTLKNEADKLGFSVS